MSENVVSLSKAIDEADEVDQVPPQFSEQALAFEFVQRHGAEARFISKWSRWYVYDGKRWIEDTRRKIFSFASRLCVEFSNLLKATRKSNTLIDKAVNAIASAKTRAAVVSLASDQLAATIDQWDKDLWLLNTPAGVVDLKTGETRAHDPDLYMTKITAVSPDPDCPTPLYDKFLHEITGDDDEMIAYLHRVVGYALTGVTREHALFFFFGRGKNGKSVLLNTWRSIFADYHKTAPIETFTARKGGEKHPTELAGLHSARLVTASETEEHQQWAESKIKLLTGGDEISARFMGRDFFEYVPQFTLIISGNHKPRLRTVDDAMRRRFQLIPFPIKISPDKRDTELAEKLKGEWPGILYKMVVGCLDWQKNGLSPPPVVVQETDAYLQSEDTFKLWLDENCVLDKNSWVPSDLLIDNWNQWCKARNEDAGTGKRLTEKLKDLDLQPERQRGKRGWKGIALAM